MSLAIMAFVFLFFGTIFVWASLVRLPDISSFQARKIANSSKITDRTGKIILYDIHQSVRRTEIPLSEMGDTIKHAVIAIEDSHFYEHKGIRIKSIIRAFLIDIIHGSFKQGGSTITQQIVKNTLLTNDKTVTRKFKEWILAIKLERYFTKDQILQIYLNDAPYGGTIYGVEEASTAYFNKHSKDLTIAESAYLAAIPEAPTYYSPFGKNKTRLEERKNTVLKRMLDLGYITQQEYESAKNEQVAFNNAASNSIKAPHFVFYILDYLQQKYGRDVMESGGYTIKTTIDFDMQQKAEEILKTYSADNLKKFNASNAALVAIDPTTGQILAMVGSKDYFSKDIDGAFNVAVSPRQPGSSFKPFVYATAFAKGYTAETILFDLPTEFSTSCSVTGVPLSGSAEACYHPSNFDNKFKGPISLRSAIAESRNVPSVKLLYLVGLDDTLATAKSLGITSLGTKDQYGLSLVLGGGEVTLLDMVGAYGVFANSGVRNPTTGILDITDRVGTVIEQFSPNPIIAFDRNASLMINDVLSDATARFPTFYSSITIAGVAVKTGTTNDDRDAWIIGYTPKIAVGVWSGNNRNEKMRSGGAAVSGPMWKSYMQELLKNTIAPTEFEKPIPDPDYQNLKPILRGIWLGNETVAIDTVTGLRATPNTPVEARVEKVITNVQDTLYWIDKKDPRGPAPKNPNQDPQFKYWNYAVQTWWQENMGKYTVTRSSDLPSGFDSLHTGENADIRFIGLENQIDAKKTTLFSIESSGAYPLTSVDLYIDGNYLTTLSRPFRFSFSPKEYGYTAGTHTIKAVATDSIFSQHTGAKTVIFTE